MCKCKSYNKKVKGAKHPNIILEVPKRFRVKYLDGTVQRTIAVDKCMAKRLVSLWAAGLATKSCCCGHNKFMPTVVIPEEACVEDYFKILDRYGPTCVAQWCERKEAKGKFKLNYYIKVDLAILHVALPPAIDEHGLYVATEAKD